MDSFEQIVLNRKTVQNKSSGFNLYKQKLFMRLVIAKQSLKYKRRLPTGSFFFLCQKNPIYNRTNVCYTLETDRKPIKKRTGNRQEII